MCFLYKEAPVATTSSQILLSRAIADPYSPQITPEAPTSTLVTVILENNTQHIMTLGEAADLRYEVREGSHDEAQSGKQDIVVFRRSDY